MTNLSEPLQIVRLFLCCSEKYGHKKDFAYVASKFPLPRYRPEFDPRVKQRHSVFIASSTAAFVRMALNTMRQNTGDNDWVEGEIPQLLLSVSKFVSLILLICRFGVIGGQ